MMQLPKHALYLAGLFLFLLAGCGTQVERVDVKEVHDLSGAWNDTDSRLVSEEMIEDMVSSISTSTPL
jgi:hypothetical protein